MHLVTGGSGYFGETLVRLLLAKGLAVRVLDLNPIDIKLATKVDMVVGDIRNQSVVDKACQGISHIYHNVAQVPLAKNKLLFDTVNKDGTRLLLEAALKNKASKVIYTSSSAIYGIPNHNPVTETTPPAPLEPYGAAKLAAEKLCEEYSTKGLDVTIMRPRTILGHGRLGIFQILFEWIYQGYNIPILGDGNNRYQFIHAHDFAEACMLAAQVPGSDSFNVGAAEFGTMAETLTALIIHAQSKSQLRKMPLGITEKLLDLLGSVGLVPLAPYHSLMYGRALYFDISKAQNKLHWQPRYSNTDMICEAYDWYLKHRQEVLLRKHASMHRSAIKQGLLNLVRFLP